MKPTSIEKEKKEELFIKGHPLWSKGLNWQADKNVCTTCGHWASHYNYCPKLNEN